jgi:hypothetical protein
VDPRALLTDGTGFAEDDESCAIVMAIVVDRKRAR